MVRRSLKKVAGRLRALLTHRQTPAIVFVIVVSIGVLLAVTRAPEDGRATVFVAALALLISLAGLAGSAFPSKDQLEEADRRKARRERGVPEAEETLATIATELSAIRALLEEPRSEGRHP